MRISRRTFVYGIAATTVASAASGPPPVYERRVYASASILPPPEILSRHGIRPLFIDGTEYLIPFATLEVRAHAWDKFNTDDDWCAIRDGGNVALQEIQIYPGGKIFEMSL